MTMRLIKLPADLAPLGEMLGQTFQYPENEAWSVQTDEKEQLVDAIWNTDVWGWYYSDAQSVFSIALPLDL